MPLWSHSRISAFEQCPRRYAYRYVEKPDVDKTDSIEAFVGTRVHEALEQLYRDVRMHKEVTLDELLAEFDKNWQKHYHDGIKIVRKRYNADNYYQVGRRCLTDYYRRHHPFSQTRTLGLEERIVIDLDMKGEYKLQGYIDRLAQVADGHYEIHDYKTSNSLPGQVHFDSDRQLALYQIGVERRFGDAHRVDLVWHYLQYDRELRSRREPEQLAQLRFDTIGTIQSIEAESRKGQFPTRESALCDWCEFFAICPAKKHLAKVQDLPVNEFMADDGVKLVQEFVRLKAEKRQLVSQLDGQIERVKDAIVALARREGADTLYGAEYKVRVRFADGLKVPTQKDDNIKLEALKSKLRDLNLWEEVTSFDRNAVMRLINGDDLTDEQRRALEAELVPDDTVRINESRLKPSEQTLGED